MIEWFDQDVVSKSRCIVVGAGAVGNEVVKNLALLGIGRIDVFDFDLIEEHNLTRSVLFRPRDVGRAKAVVVAERAGDLGGETVTVTAHVADFWDALHMQQIQEADRVYCCVDSVEARIGINTLCALLRVDLVNVGIDSRFVAVETFPFSRALDVACYECSLPPSVYGRIERRYACGWLRRIGLVERKVPTTIVTSSLAGSMAVSLSIMRASEDGAGASMTSGRWFADSRTGATSHTTIDRRPMCPGCAAISGEAVVIPIPRQIGCAPANSLSKAADGQRVIVSEKVVTGFTCLGCGDVAAIWRAARLLDQTLTDCPRCGPDRRKVDTHDTFTWGELRTGVGGLPLPGKFLRVPCETGTLLFEMEDSNG
jgi:molybdopterin/thiamine biosynthesis adenylyltransferase